MTFEEQLELVDQVMMDRSLPSRGRVRLKRLYELGLPKDADITQLFRTWQNKATTRAYKENQPRYTVDPKPKRVYKKKQAEFWTGRGEGMVSNIGPRYSAYENWLKNNS